MELNYLLFSKHATYTDKKLVMLGEIFNSFSTANLPISENFYWSFEVSLNNEGRPSNVQYRIEDPNGKEIVKGSLKYEYSNDNEPDIVNGIISNALQFAQFGKYNFFIKIGNQEWSKSLTIKKAIG